MSIALEYFCTKTGKPIEVDGKPLIETLENTAAEYLYGNDVKWSIGIVYPGISTEDDLTKHQDKYLQFSKKDRLYFSDKPGLRLQIFDEPHFGSAYGSLLFGECEYFAEVEDIKVLIVDDETGKCGGVLPEEQALLLVGDGDGRIDHKLHEKLGNIPSAQFQVRGIIKSQEGINANQTIKGTLAPVNLSSIGSGYDLVLSKSQLGKGRKNKLYNEKTGIRINRQTEVEPGEYTLTIGIGNRENARTVEAATGAQYWVGLSEGAKNDALPRVQERLAQLDSIANDPRKVALDYIQTVERRLAGDFKRETGSKLIHDFDLDDFGDVINEAFGDNDTELMYQLLKADLEGHLQIIETPKVINFLSEHLQEQYRDCATGRIIKFQSSMLMTCNRLKDWEICDRTKPNGAKVLYHRPPVGNTNVMAVLTNRLLEGEEIHPGSIKLNRRTATALNSDCDGDKPLTALAQDFPSTTEEIQFKTQPENRYPESVLPQKAAYCGSFEKIALEAAHDNIGIVANLAMKAIAIESECSQIPANEQRTFLANLSANLARCASDNLPKEAEHLRELLNDFSEYNRRLNYENQSSKNAFQDYLIPAQESELNNTITSEQVSEGLAKAQQVIITTTKGNSIEVNKLKSGAFADVDWNKQSYQATVTISVKPSKNSQKPNIGIAMIKDKKLGELKPESFEKLTAVLKAHNILIQGYTVKGKITAAPPSAAKVVIDASTVEYPQEWSIIQQNEPSENKFLLVQQVQANRTLEVAPIIHAFLSTQDKTTVAGKLNTVSWNPQTQEITLWTNGSSNPKMRVKYSDGEYQALSIGNTLEEIEANGLSEADVQHFQQIAPSIYARIAGNQSVKIDNNVENGY